MREAGVCLGLQGAELLGILSANLAYRVRQLFSGVLKYEYRVAA